MNVTKRARTCGGLAILMTMLLLTALLSLSASAAETVSQHERVRVGFFAMDGYHMMDEDGNRSGYGYDFLRLMARYWDVDYEYVGYDKSWEEMQQMLIDGEIDMVTSARRTPEREELFDFSRPIGTNNGILTVAAIIAPSLRESIVPTMGCVLHSCAETPGTMNLRSMHEPKASLTNRSISIRLRR